MGDDDHFGMLEWNEKAREGAIVLVSTEGVTSLPMWTEDACECPCRGILYNGVVYGPGTYAEVASTVASLDAFDPNADFSFGDHSYLHEKAPSAQRLPLSDWPFSVE